MKVKHDWSGTKFNRLTVLSIDKEKSMEKGRPHYICQCSCGNMVSVRADNIKDQRVYSCGCYNKDRQRELQHRHGMVKTPIWRIWHYMKSRCDNPTATGYHNYGGRGILYDDRWADFKEFYADMGEAWFEGATLDRIDVNGNYCKENCRWITMPEQYRNKRNTAWVEHKGEKKPLKQVADEYGWTKKGDYNTIFSRIFKNGWELERALTTPIRRTKRENIGAEV